MSAAPSGPTGGLSGNKIRAGAVPLLRLPSPNQHPGFGFPRRGAQCAPAGRSGTGPYAKADRFPEPRGAGVLTRPPQRIFPSLLGRPLAARKPFLWKVPSKTRQMRPVGAATWGRPLFEGRFSVWRGLAPAAPEASIPVVGRGLPDAPPRNSGRRRGGDTRSRPALRLKIEYGFFGSTKSGRHAPSAGANRHIVLAARGTMRWVRLPSYVYVRYRYMGTVTYDVYHRTPVLCGWVWG